MAHMTKKAEFLAMVAALRKPNVKRANCAVYLYDGDVLIAEVYRASNMQEAGIISAMNQSMKYRKWMEK